MATAIAEGTEDAEMISEVSGSTTRRDHAEDKPAGLTIPSVGISAALPPSVMPGSPSARELYVPVLPCARVLGLRPGRQYQFRLRALNEIGESDWYRVSPLRPSPILGTHGARGYMSTGRERRLRAVRLWRLVHHVM